MDPTPVSVSTPSQRVTREDLLTFISAAFACTGQREFYSDGYGQSVSIRFLHEYVLGNYRRLYARVLACGINDSNQAEILFRLLSTGRKVEPNDRAEENALITRAIHRLPTQRAMRLFSRLAESGVNNRRTRAILKRYLSDGERRDFRAVKYRRRFQRSALHVHLRLEGELASLFLKGWKQRRFQTRLFESFRQAHFAEKPLYDLPYSIAEGLAAKLGVPRDRFLERIAPRMTSLERLRLQETTFRETGKRVSFDPARLSPTRIASYILSLPIEERRARRDELAGALEVAVARAVQRTGVRYGRVACVLDRSWSSSGSSEKRRRPLAVALATSFFVRAASEHARSFWTTRLETLEPRDEIFVSPFGQTDLATSILEALEYKPDILVVVSDAFENDPPDVAGDILASARRLRLCPFVLHINPVYDDTTIGPRPIAPRARDVIPTMGVRDAEDLPTAIAFASFASGSIPMRELERVLSARVAAFLGGTSPLVELADEVEPVNGLEPNEDERGDGQ